MDRASGAKTSHLLGQAGQLFCRRIGPGRHQWAGPTVGWSPGSGAIGTSRGSLGVFGLPVFCARLRATKTNAREGRLEKIIERLEYDLTVFKVHFGKLTLKMYDKGNRVLRVEVIVNNIEELRCGKRVEKLPGMLERLEAMVVAFLEVVQAAHLSFVDGQQLDALAVPSVRGARRRAGVDLQKARMRAVAEAVIALAAQPEGFTAANLAERVRGAERTS